MRKYFSVLLFVFLVAGFPHLIMAQPYQVSFDKIQQIKPEATDNHFEYSVTINGKTLTEQSWIVILDSYLKIQIQIQRTKSPKVFGIQTQYIDLKKIDESDNTITIPVKAHAPGDSPDKFSYIWNVVFHISN